MRLVQYNHFPAHEPLFRCTSNQHAADKSPELIIHKNHRIVEKRPCLDSQT